MRPARDPPRHEVLPAGALRCVWMTAGVLTYKLCDRGLACERCPVDAALGGGDRRGGAARGPSGVWCFPSDRRYSAGHTWAQVRGPETARVGLDAFAAGVAPIPLGVALPATGDRVERDRASVALHTSGGDLRVALPLGGVVLRSNRALADDPGAAVEAPYEEGWLVDLLLTEEDLAPGLAALLTGAEMRGKAAQDARRYLRAIGMELLAGSAVVGPTLQDGGEPAVSLRQLVPAARQLEIAQSFLT